MDEKLTEVDSIKFNRKLSSDLFLKFTTENDSVVFEGLRVKNYFGRLSIVKKSELNKIFHKRFDIDSTKIWVIYYNDSISKPKVNTSRYSSNKVFKNSSNEHKVLVIDEFKNVETIDIKKFNKLKGVSLLFFYGKNKGYSTNKKVAWRKDYGSILKRTFTDGIKMYKYIIVHPNGDFHMWSKVKSFEGIKKLLNIKSYKEMEASWRENIEKYN